jgi:hypothetical protein
MFVQQYIFGYYFFISECSLGYYDYNCNESCDGFWSNACDKVYGICTDTSGCKPGWQPGHEKSNLGMVMNIILVSVCLFL